MWEFEIIEGAEADLERLAARTRQRILKKLRWLVQHFDEIVPSRLEGPWQGLFKLRVGDWRVVYEIEPQIYRITVHYIDRRDKIYKRRR